MKRKCPECSENAVKISILLFTNQMHCDNCFYRYEYSATSKWILAIIGSFIPMLAVVTGIALGSWIIFLVILIVLPFLIAFYLAKYSELKPVGFRAKLNENSL